MEPLKKPVFGALLRAGEGIGRATLLENCSGSGRSACDFGDAAHVSCGSEEGQQAQLEVDGLLLSFAIVLVTKTQDSSQFCDLIKVILARSVLDIASRMLYKKNSKFWLSRLSLTLNEKFSHLDISRREWRRK